MRSLSLASTALAAVLAACAQPSGRFGPSDAAAIRASEDTFVARVTRSDWTALAALYTANAALMPPNQPAVEGRPAIEAWMRAFPPIKEFSLTVLDVGGEGDLAYVRGTYRMTFTPPKAPQLVSDHGKFIEVRHKQPDGSWAMSADIFNSDLAAK
jgi:ketosteroid isomerase-like protein